MTEAEDEEALFDAIWKRRLTDLEDIIHKGNVDINARDEDGSTPLHWASCSGYEGMVKALITAGADINAKDKLGRTPLSIASRYDEKKIVDILIEAGAKE